jgi:hypothetical protein
MDLSSTALHRSHNPRWLRAASLLALAAVLLGGGRPASAEERLGYHDTFALGYGFDPTVSKQYPSPLARRTAVRSSVSAPLFNFELLQDESDRQASSGTALAVGVEARYSGFTGKVSAAFSEVNRSANYQFSFSTNESYDYGDYRIPSIVLAPKAARLARRGLDEFVKRYGTHCVVGESRRSFLVVRYSVRHLSSAMQSSGELHVSAEGRWLIGGFKAGADWQKVVRNLAKSSAVEVRITASLANVDVTDTIQNANDIDRVLANIARISLKLNEAEPRPQGFIIEPWENLINFDEFEPRDHSRPDDPAWATLIDEYYKMKRTERRLRSYIDERRGYYDYLGPFYIVENDDGTFGGALGAGLVEVKARLKQIEALLVDWVKNPSPQHHIDTLPEFSPISIDWPRSWTKVWRTVWAKDPTRTGFGVYSIWCELYGGSRYFAVRARETTQGWVVDYPLGGASNDVDGSTTIDGLLIGASLSFGAPPRDNPLKNNNDMRGWVLEALNSHGDVVAVLDPIPNAFIIVTP